MTDVIRRPLSAEDCMVQSMPDVSPTRWHLAHTTWFFEQFILLQQKGYRVFDDRFTYLFNSYYNHVGLQFPRSCRGLISRPGLDTVLKYRAYVDEHLGRLLESGDLSKERLLVVEIGLNHEQQHQELMLTDIKHVLSCNPTHPIYRAGILENPKKIGRPGWVSYGERVHEIGFSGNGFAYDNEMPRHSVFCQPFELAKLPVTCGEYLEFIEDGGYTRPDHWLSMGWTTVEEQQWQAPLYWIDHDNQWQQFTLAGMRPIDLCEPVCHISYFEADAYARWAGYRLPNEAEWEIAAAGQPVIGNFADFILANDQVAHPSAGGKSAGSIYKIYGDVWEWTASQYIAYPGYVAPAGALGEYNGKFMCNQFVLRGGSCATASDHIRATYRNFFPPEARWQFSGLRLAR